MTKYAKLKTIGILVFIVCACTLGRAQSNNDHAAAAAPAQAEAGLGGSEFVIGPEDVLQISVWKEAEFSGQLPVRPDGKISLALLNDVQAAGLTPMQLADSLTEKLKKYISDPQVSVVVRQINSRKYYLLGEVRKPGMFSLSPEMTVLQALSAAGGFSDFADSTKIYILRQENGKAVKYPFNYKQVIRGEGMDQNQKLKPGDTIVVP